MITIIIVCLCLVGLASLIGLAGLICFVGTQTEKVQIIMGVIIVSFFIAYFVIGFTFEMVGEAYNLPMLPWEENR